MAGTALLTALSGVSCVSYQPPPDGNVFVANDGRPRYGYGGTESPNTPARERASSSSETSPTSRKKVPEIRRDPNNTTVDVTPPARKKPPVKPADSEPVTPRDSGPESPPVERTASEDTPPPPPAETKPAPPPREDLPFGTPVVGKKGFVYSPYAPDKGYVDVTDMAAGTKVECPYTGKRFRVP